MKICICQYDIEWENKQKNKEKISALLSNIKDVDLIILPETSLTGFSFKREISTITEDDLYFFCKIARDKRTFVCFGGILDEKNCCFVVSPEGKIVLKTAKIHLFNPSGEGLHHKPGTKINTVKIHRANITPFVCYDLRFAPVFWISAEKTDVFVVIANWPQSRRNHWKTLLAARAIENQAFVVGVNRTGESPKEKYCGDSCAVNPGGEIVFDAENKEAAFLVDIRISDVNEARKNFPVLKDRKNLFNYINMRV